MLQFTCPYCSGMFQVDPSMAGGEAMCPLCHGTIVVPAEAFGPPIDEHAPPVATDEFDFGRRKRGGMFDGLDDAPDQSPLDYRGGLAPANGGRFGHLHEPPTMPDAAPGDATPLGMACPHCASPFQVDPAAAGQQVMCPTCRGVITIPDLHGIAGVPPDPAYGIEPGGSSPPLSPGDFGRPPYAAASEPLSPTMRNPLPPGMSGPISPPTPAAMPSPATMPTQREPVSLRPPSADLGPPSTLLPPQAAKPLAAKSVTASEVPLSARQPQSEPGPATPSTKAPKPGLESLLPPQSAEPSEPGPSGAAPSSPDAAESANDDGAETTEAPRPLRPAAIGTSEKYPAEDKSSARKPKSRAEKIDAMLPTAADPQEEVMAERPIAVEEPPEEELPSLVTDADTETTEGDAEGVPARRLTAAERAKLRRVRTILLFAVGMLVLILAALLLPRMGYVFDISPPRK